MISNSKHRRWVANYFKGKVEEFHHHLNAIVETCDESLRLYSEGSQQTNGLGRALIYSFSSFSNTIQTLKDSGSAFLEPKIEWSDIQSLRHGAFFHLSRNAATHDGNPIISAWADGRYYIPADIVRFDDWGKLRTIPAPTLDVRTFCLEFSSDMCIFFKLRLQSADGDADLQGSAFEIDDFEPFIKSNVVPEFAKQLLAENIDQIRTNLASYDHDPIAPAMQQFDTLSAYCNSKLTGA